MTKPVVIIRDKVWVPVKIVPSMRDLKQEYTTYRYEESACRKCDNRSERHNLQCGACEAFKGIIRLYQLKTVGGHDCIGLPTGDKKNFEKKTGLLFSELKVLDKRTDMPFSVPFKFLISMRDYQQPVVDKFLTKKFGLIEAPPRTGKTAMMLYCCHKLGQRTLILASQHEFLAQFIDHIQGNVAEGIPKCTNLPELEKKLKKKLYGFPKTDEDFENFQIFTMTYQSFISEENGADRLKRISKLIGTVGVDEVHRANSTHFARVISSIPAKYKMGVTATSKRKDGLEFVINQVMGPVVARSAIEALTPKVFVHKTEAKPKRSYVGRAGWVYAMQFLAKDKKRNELIVDWVMKDLANGHNIVIPVVFKNHVLELQQQINARFGKKICEVFIGGGTTKNKEQRKQVLTDAKSNKIRVIVGIRSLLQLGLNVPTWSCIYTAMPISNEPNYKQETSRVRTPMEGKRSPIIRLFVDLQLGQSIGCARNCLKHLKDFGYDFHKSEKQAALKYEVLGSKRSAEESMDGVGEHTRVRTKF